MMKITKYKKKNFLNIMKKNLKGADAMKTAVCS